MSAPLDAERLRQGLTGRRVGGRLFCLETVESTNDLAFERASSGEPEGLVVVAEEQTRGRGRLGRAWSSPRGLGLWFSVLLRPDPSRVSSGALSILGAVAVARVIEALGLVPAIKWPNDVLLGGKKCCGILVETKYDLGGRSGAYVLGIGLDCNQAAADFPAELAPRVTSLALALGRPVDRTSLLGSLLAELDRLYERLAAGDSCELEADWRARLLHVGQPVRLQEGKVVHRGVVRRISLAEGIVLELPDGTERAFRGEHSSLLEGSP